MSAKQKALDAIQSLPDDVAPQDVVKLLMQIYAIRRGLTSRNGEDLLEPVTETPLHEQGLRMAQALESLARAGGTATIADPALWQREIRMERPLPGRDT
jgi:hypothetical protein